jgi:hypothetical protein
MHDRRRLLAVSRRMRAVNQEIDDIMHDKTQGNLERQWFILLPHNVSREVMASWLRNHGVRGFDRSTLERLTVAAKTASHGKAIDVVKGHSMHVGRDDLALKVLER